MFESGYYPAGAEFDPRAPWNEPPTEYYEVNVTIEYCNDEDGEVLVQKDITVTIEVCGSIDNYEESDIYDFIYDEVKPEAEKLTDGDFEILNYEFV